MIKALSEKLKKKKKGFTLIELIIVIAIIAIIAAFAIPNYMKVQKNAKIDADINLGRTIAQAVEVMTVDGTIGTEKEEGKEKTVELKVNEANSEEDAKKIEGYIKEGTLKLKTKGAGDTLTITISEDGKVESIVNNDTSKSVLYGKGAPSGIFKK